jgi:hypothetical protein
VGAVVVGALVLQQAMEESMELDPPSRKPAEPATTKPALVLVSVEPLKA